MGATRCVLLINRKYECIKIDAKVLSSVKTVNTHILAEKLKKLYEPSVSKLSPLAAMAYQ